MIKQYEKYKTTGFHLIEKIPLHWQLQKIKFFTDIYNGDSLNDDYKRQFESDDLSSLAYISSKDIHVDTSEVQYENGLRIPSDFGKFKIANANSSLLCIEGGSAGRKLAFINQDVYFVNKLACFQTHKKETSKFLYYSIKANIFQSQFKNSITGMIGGVSISSIKNFYLSIPSLEEQTKITEYLDSQTGIIDELISKKQSLIELLKEKRQAIINETVTKGLNPNVKMKDSGIDWLGNIPEHWIVSKLKFLTSKIVDGAHFTPTYVENGVPFLRVTDIQTKEINLDKVKYIPEIEHLELVKRCNPEKGDVLLSKNGTIGITKIIDWDWEFSIFVSLCLIKFSPKLSPKYFIHFFNSSIVDRQISDSSKTTSVTNLHLEKIKELIIAIPPDLNEQINLSNHLQFELDKFDGLIKRNEKLIKKLIEYRQSIIAEAVTGKIDVREWEKPNSKF